MTVPLPVLNRLDDKQLEWLVAGLIREKLQLLIKALPKQVRRVCVPVPDFVTRFLEREPNQHEPILPQLAAFIAREFGDVRILEQIDFDAWEKKIGTELQRINAVLNQEKWDDSNNSLAKIQPEDTELDQMLEKRRNQLREL